MLGFFFIVARVLCFGQGTSTSHLTTHRHPPQVLARTTPTPRLLERGALVGCVLLTAGVRGDCMVLACSCAQAQAVRALNNTPTAPRNGAWLHRPFFLVRFHMRGP